jgi:hypothetical protein
MVLFPLRSVRCHRSDRKAEIAKGGALLYLDRER